MQLANNQVKRRAERTCIGLRLPALWAVLSPMDQRHALEYRACVFIFEVIMRRCRVVRRRCGDVSWPTSTV